MMQGYKVHGFILATLISQLTVMYRPGVCKGIATQFAIAA